MGVDQIVALCGAAALVLGSAAALIKSVADIFGAARKKDTAPAPQVGIPATAPDDEIDYRAYADAIARAKTAEAWSLYWMRRAAGENPTPPTDPETPGSPS